MVCGFTVYGLRFVLSASWLMGHGPRVMGYGLWVMTWGLCLRVWGQGSRVLSLEFEIQGLRFRGLIFKEMSLSRIARPVLRRDVLPCGL
jgi:hypothetical protein